MPGGVIWGHYTKLKWRCVALQHVESVGIQRGEMRVRNIIFDQIGHMLLAAH